MLGRKLLVCTKLSKLTHIRVQPITFGRKQLLIVKGILGTSIRGSLGIVVCVNT